LSASKSVLDLFFCVAMATMLFGGGIKAGRAAKMVKCSGYSSIHIWRSLLPGRSSSFSLRYGLICFVLRRGMCGIGESSSGKAVTRVCAPYVLLSVHGLSIEWQFLLSQGGG